MKLATFLSSLGVVVLFACSGGAQAQPQSAKQDIKQDARTAGHEIGDGARDVGHATRDTAIKIGHGARDAGRDIAKGARQGWDATRHAFKDVFHSGE